MNGKRFGPVIRDLARALVAAGIVVVVTLCLAYYAYLARRMFGELRMNDFGRFYYSARAFLDGQDMYGPTMATAIRVGSDTYHLWNMNPPHFHLLILPLALVPPLAAVLVWAGMSALALVTSLWLIARELNFRWTAPRVFWAATGVILCSATGTLVVTGQVGFVLMLPVTLAWRAARHDRWTTAAVYLGLAAGVKPFLGIFWLYLVWTRRFRAGVVMAVTGLASMALGLAIFGPDAYRAWLRVLAAVDWGFAPMNASIQGVLARTLTENPIFVPLVHARAAVAPAAAGVGLLVGAATLITLSRDKSGASADSAFAGLVLASLLASPLGWMYYLWLAAGPLAALSLTIQKTPNRARDLCLALAVPGLLLPLYMTTIWADSGWGALTFGSLYAWTVLALWASVLLDVLAKGNSHDFAV